MYKLILKMAWKNAFLRRSRTLLLIGMIAVSMSMMLGIQGLYDGMAKNMIDKNRRSGSGDISMYAKKYRIDKDIAHRIDKADTLKTEIKNISGVKAIVTRLSAQGLVSTARKSSFASLQGIDVQEEEDFGKFSEFLKTGKIDLRKQGALIGLELAKTLKVKLGSKIIFSTQDSLGEINSVALRIRGIVQTTNISLDSNAIFVDKKKMFELLSMPASQATQIAIMGDDERLYKTLKTKYPDLEVKTFLQLQPMMQQIQDVMLIFNSITFFIVMTVVFVGIMGVMYVSVLDRIREFGIVLGIGMQYRYIRLQIFLEAIFVGLLGYLMGAILGAVILVYLRDVGLDLSEFSDALEMWGYEAVIYATIKSSYFSTTFVAIILASVLSVLLPLRRIKKLNPIEVIKAEK